MLLFFVTQLRLPPSYLFRALIVGAAIVNFLLSFVVEVRYNKFVYLCSCDVCLQSFSGNFVWVSEKDISVFGI